MLKNNITVATARHDFGASRVKKTQIMFLYEKLAKLSLPMLELTVACSLAALPQQLVRQALLSFHHKSQRKT
jgi:hypothetical protein